MANSITLFVMARDEERCVRRCIESARLFVDEVLILDTGSKDDTVTIAKAAGANIIHRPWTEHFADSRNFGLSAIKTDYVLSLDADEWLTLGGEQLIALRNAKAQRLVFEVGVVMDSADAGNSIDNDSVFFTPRLFPRDLHYRGRVHEVLVSNLPISRTNLRIKHDGYDSAQQKRKAGRNLALLEQALVEDHGNPLNYYYYAKELRGKLESDHKHIPPHDLAIVARYFTTCLKLLSSDKKNRELVTREALLFFREYELHSEGIKLIFAALEDDCLSRELSYMSAVFLYEQVLSRCEIPNDLLTDAADGLFSRILNGVDRVSDTYPFKLDVTLLYRLRAAAIAVNPKRTEK